MIHKDISVGADPIMADHDIVKQEYIFRVDGRDVTFSSDNIPFTLTYVERKGRLLRCADRSLILKHESTCREAMGIEKCQT